MRQNFHSSRLLTPHLHLLLLSSRLLQPYCLYHCLFHQLRLHTLQFLHLSLLTCLILPIHVILPIIQLFYFLYTTLFQFLSVHLPVLLLLIPQHHTTHILGSPGQELESLRRSFSWLINLLNLILSNKPPRIQIGFQPWKRNTKLSYKTIPDS